MQSIRHFRLRLKISEGVHADVFDASMGLGEGRERSVALKLLSEDATPERRSLFAAEAALLAGLTHPNVPALIDFADGDRPHMAFAWVGGQTLSARLQARVRPVLEARLHLARQLASVVADLHERDVLHGDLTPENVLVDDEGHLWLIDFERAAAIRHRRASHAPQIEGQPAFLAPEVRLGRDFDRAADVFGLGATLAYIGGGTRVFDSRAHLDRLLSGLAVELPPEVPGPLRAVVQACCHPVARRRPSAAEVAEAVERAAPSPRRGQAAVRDWTRSLIDPVRPPKGPRDDLLLAYVDPTETTPAAPDAPRTAVALQQALLTDLATHEVLGTPGLYSVDPGAADSGPLTTADFAISEDVDFGWTTNDEASELDSAMAPTVDSAPPERCGLKMPAPAVVHRVAPAELTGLGVELSLWAQADDRALLVPRRWSTHGAQVRVQFEIPQGGSLRSLQRSLRMRGRGLCAADVDALTQGLLAAFLEARALRHRLPAPLSGQPWSLALEHVHLGVDGRVRLGVPSQAWAAERAAHATADASPQLSEFLGFAEAIRTISGWAADASRPAWLDAPVHTEQDAARALRVLGGRAARSRDELAAHAAVVRRLALLSAVVEASSPEPPATVAAPEPRAPSAAPLPAEARRRPAAAPAAALARLRLAGLAATTAATAFVTYIALS